MHAMLAISADDARFVRSWWPHSACDVSVIVIGQLMLNCGNDSGSVVTSKSKTRRAARTWLQRRDDSSRVEFPVDIALHQFAWIADRPFCGAGGNPARRHFARPTTPRTERSVDRHGRSGAPDEHPTGLSRDGRGSNPIYMEGDSDRKGERLLAGLAVGLSIRATLGRSDIAARMVGMAPWRDT
jgi:hypothetical protein